MYLKGSVRKSAGRVRITAQLIDALNGTYLWADRFDGSLEGVFELQDRVATSVAGVIEPALQAAETARSANRPTNDLTAYDLYLRAIPIVFSAAKRIPEALRLLDQAISRDPGYGPALAWAAVCYFRLCQDGLSDDPQTDCRKGVDLARRALQVADDDPGVLANAAMALAYFGENIGTMIALIDRAVALHPSFARGWYISGLLRLVAGQTDIAIEHMEASLRLSPRAGIGWGIIAIGAAHFVSRRSNEAVPKFLLAIQQDPNYPAPYRFFAATYAQMGRLDEAREVVNRLRGITPVVVPLQNDVPAAPICGLQRASRRLLTRRSEAELPVKSELFGFILRSSCRGDGSATAPLFCGQVRRHCCLRLYRGYTLRLPHCPGSHG